MKPISKALQVKLNALLDKGADCAPEYAEPGYDQPERGILFANWNDVDDKLQKQLENAGFVLEWEDEWSTCSECSKAIRTNPDSYSWTPSYWLGDGEILCTACALSSPEDIIESYVNHYNAAAHNWLLPAIEEAGWTRALPEDVECGLHECGNKEPKDFALALKAAGIDYLFVITSSEQFTTNYTVYVKTENAKNARAICEAVPYNNDRVNSIIAALKAH